MCLIAYTPNVHEAWLTAEQENATCQHNTDGTGCMYVRGGNVIISKSVKGLSTAGIPASEFAVHWRYATHGKISNAATHPHWILQKAKGSPYDLAMMHNGVLRGWGDKRLSDTQEYALFLREALTEDPSLLARESFWRFLDEDTKGSRLLFCSPALPGHFRRTAEREWKIVNGGVLVSNTYSLEPPVCDYEGYEDYEDRAEDTFAWETWEDWLKAKDERLYY